LVVAAVTGAITGAAAGGATARVVFVVVGGATAGVESVVVFESPFETRRESFGVPFAFASLIEKTTLSLVAWSITLVSTPATPDEEEPEACLDRLDSFEMDGCAPKNDPIGTLSGFDADALGVADGGVGLGERKRGAATAQTTRTSAASVTKTARTTNNNRLPQTGLIYSILIRKRFQHYSSIEGGHRT